jgi:hypothetical protein
VPVCASPGHQSHSPPQATACTATAAITSQKTLMGAVSATPSTPCIAHGEWLTMGDAQLLNQVPKHRFKMQPIKLLLLPHPAPLHCKYSWCFTLLLVLPCRTSLQLQECCTECCCIASNPPAVLLQLLRSPVSVVRPPSIPHRLLPA